LYIFHKAQKEIQFFLFRLETIAGDNINKLLYQTPYVILLMQPALLADYTNLHGCFVEILFLYPKLFTLFLQLY